MQLNFYSSVGLNIKRAVFFFKKKQLGYSYISLTKLKKKVLEQHSFCDANTSTP